MMKTNMANEKEENHAEIVRYLCDVHEKDLVPLLCKDCECPVCFECLTTNHAGHTMGKLSEYIDGKIDLVNDVVQKNDSACFDVKEIEENQQKKRQGVKKQVEEMVWRVTTREEEMVKEVKNVCQQTIDQITNLAAEIENPMVKDEQLLKSFMSCKLFGKDSDEDCIKCFYFYNKLKMLDQTYASGGHEGVPFTLVTRDLSTEKIFELARSEVTDDKSSSDENLEQNKTPTNPHEIKTHEGDTECYEYKTSFTEEAIDSITSISGDRSILRSKDVIFHQSNSDVNKLVDNIQHFTYIPETDEILVMLRGQFKIYRRPLSTKGRLYFLTSFSCDSVICMGHDDAVYLVVVLKRSYIIGKTMFGNYAICKIDDTGCHAQPDQIVESSNVRNGRVKIHKSSFVIMDTNKIHVTKGLIFEYVFTYTGSIGNEPASTFSPADVCTDADGNFLVIDSHDDTVHLLDKKGTLLRIIMSTEDGLSDIKCIAIDAFRWLRMGCKDGMVHFANYQHFKSTTRKERYLQRQKTKETTDSLEPEKKLDKLKILETNTA